MLNSGTVLGGRYTIAAPIGAGGMGEVYRARDERLGRDVAIKILSDGVASDPKALSRFEREAKVLATLSDPNILTIHDFGTDQGISYAVMELLKGETLRSRIREGSIPWKKAVEMAIPIAEGLSAAHSAGIIHRDLKPENIFLTSEDRLKILDFGLARRELQVPEQQVTSAPTVSRQTVPHTIMGTIPYMSPEQVRGDQADFRTDLFSLGSVLYEMISGQPAFLRQSSAETMAAILKEDPVLPQDVHPELTRIILHCLEKKPENRFQSARDLAFHLQSILTTTTVSAPEAKKRQPAIRNAVLLLGIVLLIAAGWWLQGKYSRPRSREKSIAVLPFSNLGENKENEYFSDGMTEDVILQLSKVGDMKVISRTSIMPYKKSGKSMRQIGKELGVTTILQGSVRRSENRLRIVAQLIDAETDEHIWADTYDRELQDVFEIQSEVAERIATALKLKLSPPEKEHIERKPTQNLTAYDYYLRGRESNHQHGKENNERAIEFYNRAIELDPNFSAAYAGLSEAYSLRAMFGLPETWIDSAIQMANKAIAIDPNLAEGYMSLGYAYNYNGWNRKAVAALKKALELNPNYARAAGVLGRIYIWGMGRLDEALPLMLKYAQLDPTSANAYKYVGDTYFSLRDYPKAKQWYQQSIEVDPAFMAPYNFLAYTNLNEGNATEARKILHKALSISPNDPSVLFTAANLEVRQGNYEIAKKYCEKIPGSGENGVLLGFLLWKEGKTNEARTLLEQELKYNRSLLDAGDEGWDVRLTIAEIYTIYGNKAEAIRWLTEAENAGFHHWDLTKDFYFENLRQDPQFQQLAIQTDAKVGEMRRRAEEKNIGE